MSAAKPVSSLPDVEVKMHTPFTIRYETTKTASNPRRSKELKKLYHALTLDNLRVEERNEILLQVKLTVEVRKRCSIQQTYPIQAHDCKLTKEIVDLIAREQELLNRGRAERMLTGARQRLTNLFLQYIETPEFNPEAAKLQPVPLSRGNSQPVKKY